MHGKPATKLGHLSVKPIPEGYTSLTPFLCIDGASAAIDFYVSAFGAKLAAPDRNVVAITGDGFYMFGTAIHSLWSASQYKAPYLTIVYQNRSYSTGTLRVSRNYPEGYAAKGGYHGGYFEPPIDFAAEARAAGAYGENVVDPQEIQPALQRGMDSVRNGTSARATA